jgi:hypothetical protein
LHRQAIFQLALLANISERYEMHSRLDRVNVTLYELLNYGKNYEYFEDLLIEKVREEIAWGVETSLIVTEYNLVRVPYINKAEIEVFYEVEYNCNNCLDGILVKACCKGDAQ